MRIILNFIIRNIKKITGLIIVFALKLIVSFILSSTDRFIWIDSHTIIMCILNWVVDRLFVQWWKLFKSSIIQFSSRYPYAMCVGMKWFYILAHLPQVFRTKWNSLCLSVSVSVYVFSLFKKERKKEGQTDRQTHRQTDRYTQTDRRRSNSKHSDQIVFWSCPHNFKLST